VSGEALASRRPTGAGLAARRPIVLAVLALLAAGLVSLRIGAGEMSMAGLLRGDLGEWRVLVVSRVPRTLALVLVGAGMSVAGLIMQTLVHNRFVEPSTTGTVECALLGLLAATVLAPDASVPLKTLVSAVAALGGTGLFLALLRLQPIRTPLTVPLIGIVYGGIVAGLVSFLAYRFDLLQSLAAWTLGDFSVVLRGRYELLWLLAGLVLAAYAAVDRLTVAGLGRDVAVNLGLNHRAVAAFGLVVVSGITAVTVATIGTLPFLGLVVPNLASLALGDNLRRTLPFVAVLGALLVVACDLVGRVLVHPLEIPAGAVVGALGSALFLWLLLRRNARLG
jgi:iron complex transport system permease protein